MQNFNLNLLQRDFKKKKSAVVVHTAGLLTIYSKIDSEYWSQSNSIYDIECK